ncbi:DUF6191 domain-containing protein [Allokutzneria oryzae]|uniref:DUF6191 domain-containing protein n=1 Tax=Allokutzneria oryzae TaxID=1378989 RepID=A0ABV5ZYU0_9PSEU
MALPRWAGGFEEFGSAFDAGRRHQIDERDSHSMTRDEADDGAPPYSTVDLGGGVATLRLQAEPPVRGATPPVTDR